MTTTSGISDPPPHNQTFVSRNGSDNMGGSARRTKTFRSHMSLAQDRIEEKDERSYRCRSDLELYYREERGQDELNTFLVPNLDEIKN
jgi:hypothetical protein